MLAPAFVDPHVHLRSPGREDEETIASGTAAAAAGGYCAILAMPNTDPVVDSAAVLGSLVETARREALVPTGFMAAISKRLGGEELTEMGELADAGAAAFTDDGRPVTSAGLMRRALQYGSVTGRTLALHCEEPTLSRDGQVHEGAVCAELGFAPYPALAESAMVERDLSLAGYESRPLHLMHLSAKESVEALRHAHERGVKATAEVTPHHLVLTDEAVRSLDPNVKMNPPLRADDDRRALIDALRDGTIACVATDHAPHSREEKETPFEEAPFGVTGPRDVVRCALHPPRPDRARAAGDAARAHVRRAGTCARPAGAEGRGRRPCQPRPARPRTGVDGDRERLPLPLRQLLAARPEAARRRAEDGRRRPGGPRMSAFLALEDGTIFRGESVGAAGAAFGEAVFTTAMTGYQETVTDPSFAEQLICFTAPMVGNYGVAAGRAESTGAHAKAVLMREARGPEWTAWLQEHGIVALTGIDTRSLVLRLRDGGAMRAVAAAGELDEADALDAVRARPTMEGAALVAQVSTPEPYVYCDAGTLRVAVLDYGCKRSILRRLAGAGAHVTVFPHTVDAEELLAYDAVLLSNGPGDPEPLAYEVQVVRELLGRVPVLGICLGHQLLGLATGHETYKLPFGHRGANHPVLERRSGRVLVTSQNHGFAVAPSESAEATHVSLYDGTVEGFDFPELKARSVQFHPEAGPGPHDAWPILERWVEEVRDAA